MPFYTLSKEQQFKFLGFILVQALKFPEDSGANKKSESFSEKYKPIPARILQYHGRSIDARYPMLYTANFDFIRSEKIKRELIFYF